MQTDRLNPELVRQQLVRILSSAGFTRNERLSRFVRFVVERHLEGRDRELKESVVGVEVFDRRPDYDPRQDSIVRTEAARLRVRLAEYYEVDGRNDPLILELPKGGYVPVFRERQLAPAERKSRLSRLSLAAGITGLSITLAVAALWTIQRRSAPITIAVLPLDNLSRDPADDYFADGFTEEIIRNLSVIEGLAVRSRTSSFAFKGNLRNIREAGKQLQADYILEGSVLRIGQQLRVDARLVRVGDDFTLWSGRFDRELTNVFAVQDEISRGIVNNLRPNLGGGRRRYETSIEAYDLYLRARSLSSRQSVAVFEEVIAKDPSFAPAYAGLASAYAVRSVQFPLDHPRDEVAKMRTAAEKAIQLDPLLAEAYDALALADARDGQWKQAEESFRHAIQLDPNQSRTHYDYGYWLLAVVGRLDEALQQLRTAEKMDPLSAVIQRDLAEVLFSIRRYEEASEHCRKLPADMPYKNQCMARVWLGRDKAGEAVQALVDDPDLLRNPQARGFLGYAYAKVGRHTDAENMCASSHFANEQALIFAGLGDRERTFEALERMADLGAQRVGVYLNYPEFGLLQDDPRIKAFRRKVGLPE